MSKCMGITYPPPPRLSLPPSLSPYLSFSKPAISVASTYQSVVRGKLYITEITQCLGLPFKLSRQLSRGCSFHLTDQICAFSIMMAGRQGGGDGKRVPSMSSLI